jgi:predicted nucleic acid-binding Zn finger protein
MHERDINVMKLQVEQRTEKIEEAEVEYEELRDVVIEVRRNGEVPVLNPANNMKKLHRAIL